MTGGCVSVGGVGNNESTEYRLGNLSAKVEHLDGTLKGVREELKNTNALLEANHKATLELIGKLTEQMNQWEQRRRLTLAKAVGIVTGGLIVGTLSLFGLPRVIEIVLGWLAP